MNTFGHIFRVSIFGESHGEEIGVVIDGVEPGIALSESDFAQDIARRRSGAKGTTPRVEADEPHILSGVFEGHTTGAPLTIVFKNTNTRSQDYAKLIDVPRPGHADFTANVKYGGFQDPRGGGHFSGRLTLPVVAAGVVAKKILAETIEEETNGHVQFRCAARLVEIGGITDETRWEAALDAAQQEGDSLGGIVECVVDGIPAGLGEPFWDSVESCLSHALFAIPGVRGVRSTTIASRQTASTVTKASSPLSQTMRVVSTAASPMVIRWYSAWPSSPLPVSPRPSGPSISRREK